MPVTKLREVKSLFDKDAQIDSIYEENSASHCAIYFHDHLGGILLPEQRNKTAFIIIQEAGGHPDWSVRIEMTDDVTIFAEYPDEMDFRDAEGAEYEFFFGGSTPFKLV